jgi:site-specific DNA recombinase
VLLRNEYYCGRLKYRGIAYDGKHEPIMPPELFQRVQDMLSAKLAGDRSRKHDRYLRSTIYCGRCGFRLCFTYGKTYPYYFCVGKTTKYASCDLPYLPVAEVEEVIERQYRWVYLSDEEAASIKTAIHELLKNDRETADKEAKRQTARIQQLTASRHKLMQLFYAGKLTDDLVAQEQQQLAKDIRQAESSLKTASRDVGDLEKHIEAAIELMKQVSSAYKVAPDSIRKRINQAIFERILVDRVDDEIRANGKAAEPFNTLRNVRDAIAAQKLALKTQKSTKGSKLLGEASFFETSSNKLTLVAAGRFELPTKGL